MKNAAILLISCPYQKGIGAAIADFLCEYGAKIIRWDEHLDNTLALFLLRAEWSLKDFVLDEPSFWKNFRTVA
jgi:formyltetrahydrofolate deformylase